MSLRKFICFIVFNLLVSVIYSQATCGQFIDQQNPNQNAGTYGGNQYQSFKAGFTGKLTQIDLYKNGCENFSFTLKIYTGTSNTGGLLYTNTYSFNICSQVFSILLPFASAPNVVANNFYTFELNVISSSSGSPIQLLNTTGNTYGNGTYYSGVYGSQNNWDLYFNTYVTVNPNPVPVIQSVTNCTCFGQPNGIITTQVNSGTSPFIYSWSPGGLNTANLTNAFAGTYTFTVSDVNGCSGSIVGTVSQPSPLSSSFSNNIPVSCFGGNNGSVSVSAAGGTPPYTYSWSPSPGVGSTTANPSFMSAGTYTNVVTDAAGCTATNTVAISQPSSPISTTFSNTTSVSCNGGNNGSVSVSAVGGTPPYVYSWSPTPGAGSTSATPSSMSAGTYTNVVTDGAGCTATNTVSISQPSVLTVGVFNITNVSCNGAANGSIGVAPGGGNSGYTYNWSPSPGSGQGTAVASGLAPGTYTVVLTDSKSCTASTTGTVIQPSALSGFFSSTVNVTCTGLSDGSATFQATGGTPPYSYSWSPTPGSGQGTPTASGLPAGNYTVVVTDTNSCTFTSTVFINQPAGTLVASMTSYVNVACFGDASGTAGVTVGGGTSPYTYSWSPSPGSGQGTANVGGLFAGSYTVTVTDVNNCIASAPVTISQPGQLTTSILKTDVTCSGLATGASTLIVSGGNGGYVFNWTPAPGTGQGSNVVSGMVSGTYTVSVTDINGCIKTDSVTINQPSVLIAFIDSSSNVSCNNFNDGNASIFVSGGTSPYSINWNPSPGTGQSTTFAGQLSAGTYIATVTDNNGCVKSDTVVISQPNSLSASIGSVTNVSCNGGSDGSASLIVSGGTGPYSYNWSPTPGSGQGTANPTALSAGTYTVTILDNNNCSLIQNVNFSEPSVISSTMVTTAVSCFGQSNGSIDLSVSGGTAPYTFSWTNGASTEDVTGLAVGVYTVTITDANSCNALNSGFVGSNTQLLHSFSLTSPTCFGYGDGIVNLSVTGGAPPYNFSWSNGSFSEDLFNVGAGTYTVTIRDTNNCQVTDTVNLSQPNYIVNALNVINASCSSYGNGAINLFVSGATPPFTFNWSTGDTTQNISNLFAGSYTVTITDANGCTAMNIDSVLQPPPLGGSLSILDVACFGDSTGALYSTPGGGTPPYSFSWNTGATTQDLINIPAGNYTWTVTDSNNCTSSLFTPVNQPATLVGDSIFATGIECFGASTGSIDLTVFGGTPPYVYVWSNSALTEDITGLPAGTYSVTIYDNKGCLINDSAVVSQPASPLLASVSIQASDTSICLGTNVQFIATSVNGGTSPAYQWLLNGAIITGANSDTLNIGSLQNSDTVSVQMTSSEFCITGSVYTSNAIHVTVNSVPVISSENLNQQSVCQGSNFNPIDIVVSGTGLNYQWYSNSSATTSGGNLIVGETNSLFIPLSSTVGTTYYYCVVSGLCGSDTSSVSATQVVLPNVSGSVSITSSSSVICSGSSVSFNSNTLNVGSNPTLQWLVNGIAVGGATTSTFTSTQLNTNDSIQLIVTASADACPSGTSYFSNSIFITVNSAPLVTASNGGPFCETDSIFLAASGSGTFNWSGPGGYTSLSQNPIIPSANQGNSGAYIVTVTQNGCTASDTTFVSVGSKPVVNITGNTVLTCALNTVNLTANALGSGLSYNWAGSGIVSGAGSATAVVNLSGTYTVTVSDASSGCSDTATINVSQLNTPPDLTTDTTQYLSCSVSVLTISGFSSVSGITYSWSPGGSTPNSSSTQVNTQGNYTLTVSDSQTGCTNSAVVQVISTATNPSIFSGPNASITCSNANALLIGGSTDTTVSISWSNGIGLTVTDTVIVSVPGVYVLTVTDTLSGCSSSASVTISDETGNCNDIRFYTGMTPNNDGVNDLFELINIENFPDNTVTIFNRYGMKVWQGIRYDNSTVVFRGLDSNGVELISGTYYFILEYEGKELKGWLEILR